MYHLTIVNYSEFEIITIVLKAEGHTNVQLQTLLSLYLFLRIRCIQVQYII